MGKLTVAYWDIRGLAEPIRYLLHFKNVDFEDKRYSFDDDAWQKDKFNLGLDFPNLPYLMHGDVQITQSTAILRYLAGKYGLDGQDEKQKLLVSMVEQQIHDLRMAFRPLLLSDYYSDTLKEEFIKKVPEMLRPWDKFIGEKKYLTGDNITYVDFMAYDTFDFYRLLHAEILDEFPRIKAFLNRIKSLPELQKYLSSSTYKKWPLFGPICKWGGGGDPPNHL